MIKLTVNLKLKQMEKGIFLFLDKLHNIIKRVRSLPLNIRDGILIIIQCLLIVKIQMFFNPNESFGF